MKAAKWFTERMTDDDPRWYHTIGPALTVPSIPIIRASYCTKGDAELFARAERMQAALRSIAAAEKEPWWVSLWKGAKRHSKAAREVLE